MQAHPLHPLSVGHVFTEENFTDYTKLTDDEARRAWIRQRIPVEHAAAVDQIMDDAAYMTRKESERYFGGPGIWGWP